MTGLQKNTIITFIVWNLAILVLFLWSRNGSMVHLRLELQGDIHSLYCDNHLVDTFRVPSSKFTINGRPGLGISDASRPPLPVLPQEFDNFVIHDSDGTTVLWEERFDDNTSPWHMLQGQFLVTPRGRLTADRLAMGSIGEIEWSNIMIDVDCYNPTELFILFRVIDKKNFGRLTLRFWRELVFGCSYVQNGQQSYNRIKSLAEPVSDGVRSLVLRFTKIYAVALLVFSGALGLFVLVSIILHSFSRDERNV
ncbi:hypothetical protein JXA80_00550 [bacterium]|nr:hypothetical protein [candidate division CSSED10-310 bacterium]